MKNLDNAVTQLSCTLGNDGVLVVLVPEQRGLFSFLYEVPHGVTCLLETRGKRAGVAQPGLNIAAWTTRVAYAVTQQLCTYDAPVSRCPTIDNVMCSVDLTLVFKISDAETFVYELGAARFDDLLYVSIDEKMRKFVRALEYSAIHKLRGEQAKQLLIDLNEVFVGMGVEFVDCKITGVWLPPELAENLEKITKHDIRLETLKAEHQYQVLQVEQRANLRVEEINKNNEQLKVREASQINMAQIHQLQEKLKMNRESHEAILKAEEDAQVMQYSAQAQLRRANNEAAKREKQEMNTAKSNLLDAQLKAEADYKSGVAKSYDDVIVAKEKAATITLQAEVEKAVGPQVKLQREHELSLESKKVLAKLAEYGDYNMVGNHGDSLMKSLLGGSLDTGKA